MEDDKLKLSANDEDFDGILENDNGEDYEATIEEEELLDGGDYSDELKDLEDEGEMSIEDLRKRYGYPPAGNPETEVTDNLSVGDENDIEGGDEEFEEGTSAQEIVRSFDDLGNSLSGLDDDDDDYAPPDSYKKQVRVDPIQFQAEIPNLLSEEERENSVGSDVRDDAVLLWSIQSNCDLSDEIINQYLSDIVDIRVKHDQVPSLRASKTRDDEDALCALLRNNYDIKKAKESFPFPHINAPMQTVRPDALSWDEAEIKTFEESLEIYGKDFSTIRRLKLPYRRVGEIVEFYYQWKLTTAYRIWREAHPQHVPVVQPHISIISHVYDTKQQNEAHENNEYPENSTTFPESSQVETSDATNY